VNYFGIMKNFFAASAILLMVGCAPDSTKLLQGCSTEGLTYENTSVYYNGKLAATLASVEVALDDGKLVQEATFLLTSNEYNDIAVNIIKLIQQRKENPNWEIEVELKL
jgi:predicted adenine nucleotide alpha hydrolase (AANH) superfamily ATPase